MGYTKGSDLIRCLEGLLAKTQSPNTVRIDANIQQCREQTTKCTCLSVLTDHVYDHRHCSVLCHRQRKSGRRLNNMFISSSPLSCYSLSSSLSPIHSYNSLIPASLLSVLLLLFFLFVHIRAHHYPPVLPSRPSSFYFFCRSLLLPFPAGSSCKMALNCIT